ncbi:uncharacterized protein SPPG_01509 [Spizellomyces punctatus DAOM BR117]|uniref:Cryptic loci regulator 2 N-terminal domain-containing protein n=1 Tax=Spizellomyces punctatus (strain DAOM BR117) TaxID=645134 RepID=A0A0L0HSN6_SPIPD|nr:uncharacterized protein SPPG_01509 [Spizellomyces punctatus DAOM BR117]KND04067.1 hypothetical protein SPPG_01509 [Spizellomyces punctatus DAOM BR117]|eukprot:XP_016612106.1 hypothetical protein SPPG_01509 [Spizellomyces punctatus DAOM BR117]
MAAITNLTLVAMEVKPVAMAPDEESLFASDSSLSELGSDLCTSGDDDEVLKGQNGYDLTKDPSMADSSSVRRKRKGAGTRSEEKKRLHIDAALLAPSVIPKFSDGDASLHPPLSDTVTILEGEDTPARHVWLPMLGLKAFPTGYTLFTVKSRSWTQDGQFRIDQYLYGHPSGGSYRSAKEFRPHLEWLVTGDRNATCICLLCARLSRSFEAVSANHTSELNKNKPEDTALLKPQEMDVAEVMGDASKPRIARKAGSVPKPVQNASHNTLPQLEVRPKRKASMNNKVLAMLRPSMNRTKKPAKKRIPIKQENPAPRKSSTKAGRDLHVQVDVDSTTSTPSPLSDNSKQTPDSERRRRSRRGEGGGGKWKWTMRGWVWVDKDGNEEVLDGDFLSPAAEVAGRKLGFTEVPPSMSPTEKKASAPGVLIETSVAEQRLKPSATVTDNMIKPQSPTTTGVPLPASNLTVPSYLRSEDIEPLEISSISSADLEAAEVLVMVARRGSFGHTEMLQGNFAAHAGQV